MTKVKFEQEYTLIAHNDLKTLPELHTNSLGTFSDMVEILIILSTDENCKVTSYNFILGQFWLIDGEIRVIKSTGDECRFVQCLAWSNGKEQSRFEFINDCIRDADLLYFETNLYRSLKVPQENTHPNSNLDNQVWQEKEAYFKLQKNI